MKSLIFASALLISSVAFGGNSAQWTESCVTLLNGKRLEIVRNMVESGSIQRISLGESDLFEDGSYINKQDGDRETTSASPVLNLRSGKETTKTDIRDTVDCNDVNHVTLDRVAVVDSLSAAAAELLGLKVGDRLKLSCAQHGEAPASECK